MSRYDFQIPVTFKHRIVFTRGAFAPESSELREILREGGGRKALAVVEEAVAAAWPGLKGEIEGYFEAEDVALCGVRTMPGGEAAKEDDGHVRMVWKWIEQAGIDRHSYVLAIGGGAFLDAVGHAAATAHRGVRLLRFPTTTLSQDDSGVGVKCAVNGFGKKNWVGSFAVPYAVINDFRFLETLDERTKRSGLIEAVKVALVKDAGFFEWIEDRLPQLAALEREVLEECVERSGLLHAEHIAEGGDPFETGSSRPLDFGHWAAHKLEAMTGYGIGHGEAVSIGLALDTLYSMRSGLAPEETAERILQVLGALKLPVWHPALDERLADGSLRVMEGLTEFREHLGGELTVLMLADVGVGIDVHELDPVLVGHCIDELRGLGRG